MFRKQFSAKEVSMSRFVLVLLLYCSPALAQERIDIPEAETCPRCEIRLDHLLTIGTEDGEAALAGMPVTMARDSRGRYLLVENGNYGVDMEGPVK